MLFRSGPRNWVDSGDLAMMFRGPFTTAFYRQLHTVLHREFRMRGAWRRGRRLRSLAHAAVLPLERLRLERLARVAHQPTPVSARTLQWDEAARPSPQPE